MLFKKILSSNLMFRIREIMDKSSKHNEKMPYFSIKFFFSIFVSNQREKLYKMATLTFRLADHIFFIFTLKNYMTWLSDFWSKIIRNIFKICLISWSKISKLIILESLAENIRNGYFH
jgi:hypothetical protein